MLCADHESQTRRESRYSSSLDVLNHFGSFGFNVHDVVIGPLPHLLLDHETAPHKQAPDLFERGMEQVMVEEAVMQPLGHLVPLHELLENVITALRTFFIRALQ